MEGAGRLQGDVGADLGDLRCTVPTPYGPIEAERVDGQLSLHHPPEIMLGTTSRPEDIP